MHFHAAPQIAVLNNASGSASQARQTRERIGRSRSEALRKLKHPIRSEMLRAFADAI